MIPFRIHARFPRAQSSHRFAPFVPVHARFRAEQLSHADSNVCAVILVSCVVSSEGGRAKDDDGRKEGVMIMGGEAGLTSVFPSPFAINLIVGTPDPDPPACTGDGTTEFPPFPFPPPYDPVRI